MSSLGEEQPLSINDGHNNHLQDAIQDPVALEKYSAGELEIEATNTISETDQSNAEEFKNQGNDFLKSELIVFLIKLQHNLESWCSVQVRTTTKQ